MMQIKDNELNYLTRKIYIILKLGAQLSFHMRIEIIVRFVPYFGAWPDFGIVQSSLAAFVVFIPF